MGRIRNSGGYRDLRSFQTSTIIYDATYWFCDRFVDSRSRTVDQMVQAARSGRQNIAEGSRAGAVSSQTELRLVNVARASLEELLLDYEDYLRQRRRMQWAKDTPEAIQVRQVARQNQSGWANLSDFQRADLYKPWLESEDPFIRANALICLIHQTNYLLDQQILALEKQFVEGGGYTEQLASERIKHRAGNRSDQSDPTNPTDSSEFPPCPQCGGLLVLRTIWTGPKNGQQFLGCSSYPNCKGAREL
ncbi:MAG: four helix bundle suffix domain-containing protein [Verrucomicrobiales bacterium]|nr:four helix bundle suffix domain-containing protein [Verrucomicrobiales bacterium]